MNRDLLTQAQQLVADFMRQRASVARRLRWIAEKCEPCRGVRNQPEHLVPYRVVDGTDVSKIPSAPILVYMPCEACAPVRRLIQAVAS